MDTLSIISRMTNDLLQKCAWPNLFMLETVKCNKSVLPLLPMLITWLLHAISKAFEKWTFESSQASRRSPPRILEESTQPSSCFPMKAGRSLLKEKQIEMKSLTAVLFWSSCPLKQCTHAYQGDLPPAPVLPSSRSHSERARRPRPANHQWN